MSDDIFDTYLRDILNKKPEDKQEEAEKGDEDMSQVLGEPVRDEYSEEPTRDFDSKTIKFSNGGVAQMLSVMQKSETKTEERPVKKTRKRLIKKVNYSAYGGIVLSTVVLCASILISLFVIVVGRDFLGIDTNSTTVTLYIQPMSENYDMYSIANLLEQNGIIEYPQVFVKYARFMLGGDTIYPGDIDVKPSMSYSQIIDLLRVSRESHETITVTIPEGYTIDAAAALLEEKGVCDASEFVFTFNTAIYGFEFESYVSSSSLKYYKYEGYLFPDTYEFYVDDSAYNIVKKIKERTNEILNDEVIKRCGELGYSLDQIVTLASILQLESGHAESMPDIAGVFYNRLSNPEEYPRLQTDTTKKYIENVIKSGNSTVYQEMRDSYDTYVCNGLPIGAICNPGEAAIRAALYPNSNNYYFFCSDSETGEFYYAETYEEHIENIERAGLSV